MYLGFFKSVFFSKISTNVYKFSYKLFLHVIFRQVALNLSSCCIRILFFYHLLVLSICPSFCSGAFFLFCFINAMSSIILCGRDRRNNKIYFLCNWQIHLHDTLSFLCMSDYQESAVLLSFTI